MFGRGTEQFGGCSTSSIRGLDEQPETHYAVQIGRLCPECLLGKEHGGCHCYVGRYGAHSIYLYLDIVEKVTTMLSAARRYRVGSEQRVRHFDGALLCQSLGLAVYERRTFEAAERIPKI